MKTLGHIWLAIGGDRIVLSTNREELTWRGGCSLKVEQVVL